MQVEALELLVDLMDDPRKGNGLRKVRKPF